MSISPSTARRNRLGVTIDKPARDRVMIDVMAERLRLAVNEAAPPLPVGIGLRAVLVRRAARTILEIEAIDAAADSVSQDG